MNEKILIIEDNEQNLYLMKFLLEKRSFKTFPARSGIEGVEMASQLEPDAILLDIQLPEMDGYAIAKRIRNIDKLKQTPIIVVTSYAMVGDREKALEAGATEYIEKPINPVIFVDQVETVLKKKGEYHDQGSGSR